jgi:hypothetical protein
MLPLIRGSRDLNLTVLHLDTDIRMKSSSQRPVGPSDLDRRTLNSGLLNIYFDAGRYCNRQSSYA